jgi:hypothetical protein
MSVHAALSSSAKRRFSWDYVVRDADGALVAELEAGWVRRAGAATIGGETHTLGRVDGSLVLERDGRRLALATKRTPLFRRFEVEAGDWRFVLEARSMFGRPFVLLEDGEVLGSIEPAERSRREVVSHLPEELPLALRVFLTWLVLVQWRTPSYLAADPPRRAMARVMRAGDSMEAALVRAELESEGIAVQLVGGMSAGGFGELPRDALNVDVLVPAERVQEAREVHARVVARARVHDGGEPLTT